LCLYTKEFKKEKYVKVFNGRKRKGGCPNQMDSPFSTLERKQKKANLYGEKDALALLFYHSI